jgi:hypothetical protein
MRHTYILAGVLLLAMAALMWGPARQDSATVDETTFLSAGYTYWTGHRYYMVAEHPPLSQMLPALPLLFMDLKYSPNAKALIEGRAGYPWTVPWFGPPQAVQQLFPRGRDNWYFLPLPESQLFGQMFVYDGTNNGDEMMLAGRVVQMLLTLGVGALIFYWVRRVTTNDMAAFLALALWVFNPVTLAYGHLIITDISVVLPFAAAILLFGIFLERPSVRLAAFCGIVTAVAVLMKYTAVTLGPIYIVMTVLHWKKLRESRTNVWKMAAVIAGAAWATVLIVYFPKWSPAPPLPQSEATTLGVPDWFQNLRAVLIPPDFFKGLALKLAKSKIGHDAYLFGEWSQTGWWYYFPLALFYKSPLAYVVLCTGSVIVSARAFRSSRPLEFSAWVAVVLFMFSAMTSKVNIGVRHILPVFALLCVGIGCAFHRLTSKKMKLATAGFLAWQALVTAIAYPLFLQYFSEAVGGARNGYKYLVDSNYDWGQDAVRLKRFLEQQQINHIYLDYFGTQFNIEYLKIPNTRVNAEKARQITRGVLVVSVSQLVRPEWAWLRESRQPMTRVAHTLFVYQFP